MKKIINSCIAIIFYTQLTQADNMVIMNLTSQQVSVTLDAASKSFTMQTNPNENLYVQQNLDHQSNQYDNPLATLTYDHAQIKKITIHRSQSDMPQIIYYNDEITSDNQGKPSGIYGTFIARGGNLQIFQDEIKVNGLTYNSNDLNSFKIKCQSLKNQLSVNGKIDDIQKEVNDLSQSLRLIELSDAASAIGLQVAVIKSELDNLVNKIQVVHQTNEYHNNLENIAKNLTPENVNEVQEKINNMQSGLSTLDQTDTQNLVNPDAIKKEMAQLQTQVTLIKDSLSRTDNKVLINADSPTA